MAIIQYPSGGAVSLNAAVIQAGGQAEKTVYIDGNCAEVTTVNAAVTDIKIYRDPTTLVRPVIRQAAATHIIQYGQGWDIYDLEFDGTGNATDGLRGQAGSSTGVRIRNCVVHDVTARAFELKADAAVSKCLAYSAGRGFVQSGPDVVVQTCIAALCVGNGFELQSTGRAYHCCAGLCDIGFLLVVGSAVYNSISRSNTQFGYWITVGAVPAISCFGWGNGTNDFKGGTTDVPATCSDADPDLSGAPTADPADWVPNAGAPVINFCTKTVGSAEDWYAQPRPVGPPDAGIYEWQFPVPEVLSATAPDFVSVVVTFDQAMAALPDLEDHTLWSVVPLGAGVATVIASATQTAPDEVTLVVSTMSPAQGYRVTAPATVESTFGIPINPLGRSADFTTGSGTIVSVACPDRWTVVVTFDFVPVGGSLLVVGAWAVEHTDGASDEPPVDSVAQDGVTVTLTMLGPLSPGGSYEVTVPADVPDVGGASATFVCDDWRTAASDEGVLEALTGAFGSQLAKVGGQPVTRLAAPLAPADVEALVESTLHFPATGGVLRVGSEKIPYTAATSFLLTGLVRTATVVDTYPIGTEVRDDSYEWGQARRAWAETTLSKCPDDFVDVAARDKGSPAPLAAMPTDDRRTYAQVRHYLDAGTWWAVFRVLREGFRWASRTGTDARTYATASGGVRRVDIPQASLPPAEPLHDRWIVIGGRVLRVRAARSDIAAGQTTLYVEANGGSTWEPSEDFTDTTGVSWELLAYRLVECQIGYYEADRLFGLLVVYLYITAGFLPATYLIDSGLATPQSRLMRGKLGPYDPVTNEGYPAHQSFYLAQPYRTAVLDMLSDVVPAWCEIRVVMQRAAT